jgi:hypothetical protein
VGNADTAHPMTAPKRGELAGSGDESTEGTIVEWSRELARGRVQFYAGITRPFDASIADADDFFIGERVRLWLRAERVTAVAPMPEQALRSARLEVRLAPAGIFRLERPLTNEQVERLGERLNGLGNIATLDLYPSFICMTGWQTAIDQGAPWRAFEERLAASLDGLFGYGASMRALGEALVGETRAVAALVAQLERHHVPPRPVQRMFSVVATRPVAWEAVPSELEGRFRDTFREMPGWVGWRDGVAHWFIGEFAWPFLTVSRTAEGLEVKGILGVDDWQAWLRSFEPRLDLLAKGTH